MALSWFKKLKDGLNKTSENLSEGFKDVFVRKKLDDEMLENLEEVLISSDMGIETALSLTEQLRQEKFEKDITEEMHQDFYKFTTNLSSEKSIVIEKGYI